MPVVTANGKKFTFPEGTSNEDIAIAIDSYFANQLEPQGQVTQTQAPGVNATQIQTPTTRTEQVQTPGQTFVQQEQVRPLTETEIEAQKEIARQESAPPQEGLFKKIGKAFRGEEGQETKKIPEFFSAGQLGSEGIFKDATPRQRAQLAGIASLTTNPNEMAQIVSAMDIPNIQIRYQKDNAGNILPIITNTETRENLLINRPGFSEADAVNLAASGLAFTPAGRASTIVGGFGKNAATQAAIEAAQAASGGEFSSTEAALAGVLGSAPKAIESGLSSGGRFIANRQPSQEAQEILRSADELDIPIFTSDVVPPTTRLGRFSQFVGETVPIFGTGSQRALQQEAREEALQNVTTRMPDFEEIQQSLIRQNQRANAAAVTLMDRASNSISNNPIKGGNAIDYIDNQIQKIKFLPNGEPRAGFDQAKVTFLENQADNIISNETFGGIRDLRTTIRQDYNLAVGDPALVDQSFIDGLYSAMTRDLDQTVKSDLGEQAFKQWKQGNTIYAKEAEKIRRSKIKKLFESGEISRRDVRNVLLNPDDKARRLLYRSLDTEGRKNAQAAIIQDFISQASRSGNLSVNQFTGLVRRNKDVINDFFKGSAKREVNGLMKALQATEGAQKAAQVNLQTGQAALPAAGIGAAVSEFRKTLGTAAALGYAARIYESPAVRNILLRINATPKGHHTFEGLLEEASNAINSVIQTSTEASDILGESEQAQGVQ
jgi:hypothetical protein